MIHRYGHIHHQKIRSDDEYSAGAIDWNLVRPGGLPASHTREVDARACPGAEEVCRRLAAFMRPQCRSFGAPSS